MFLSLGKNSSLYIIFAMVDTVDEFGDPCYTFMGTAFGYTDLMLEDTHSYSVAYDPDTNFPGSCRFKHRRRRPVPHRPEQSHL
ncbi:MAG: hypothetical protein ACLU9S_22875 [Oscillospiraceae bacterium]